MHGAVTGWYPYPFLDVATIGFADSVRNSAVVLVIGVAIAAVLTILDRRLPSLVRDRPRAERPAATVSGIAGASD